MKKLSFFVTFLGLMLNAHVAQASNVVLTAGNIVRLPECGGTLQLQQQARAGADQINLIFREVRNCSNFDIVSKTFGLIGIEYKARKISENSNGARSGSFTLPGRVLERGLNDVQVAVYSNSRKHEDTISLVFVDRPVVVNPPVVRPPVVPVSPNNLRGFCQDTRGENFVAARSFAYSTSGLDLSQSEAAEWAARFVPTHRCNAIDEFRARFETLYQYAYSTEYQNRGRRESIQFALANAETVTVSIAREWMRTFNTAEEFFYSNNYLNQGSAEAKRNASQWVERSCGSSWTLESMKSEFRKEFDFAYSVRGLNMSSGQARSYAARKVSIGMQRCADLVK